MKKSLQLLVGLFASFGAIQASAIPVYLNQDNISVQVGAGTTATTSNNTFFGGNTIDKVIDAPSAGAAEIHSQASHIWYSGGGLELLFDFGTQYDLSTLHFWNYHGESYDVDKIDFTFFDSTSTQVGALSLMPDLGSSPSIYAQDIALAAPLNVQYVTAFLSGTNGQVDFQNIGFTADLSTDRCLTNPSDPICDPGGPSSSVPEPSSLMLFGLAALVLGRRRSN
ncbi:PEP-CTERM sorting domain-containing protein [Alkalimarinus coralli]|uniref:PEP-CTERM sorting domain-containing protein n=1 Tax=Alkalimarinus coralli TaxID=2935863 RepID=UPI00202AF6E9|nr:PEP-CTERM sorting domain-containing protein [Alkalimarinus coralli]